ncbi:hypothetical protein D9M68_654030 [compost metagenome]
MAVVAGEHLITRHQGEAVLGPRYRHIDHAWIIDEVQAFTLLVVAFLVQHRGENDLFALSALKLVHGVPDEIRWQVRAGEGHLCPERRDETAAVAIQPNRLSFVLE